LDFSGDGNISGLFTDALLEGTAFESRLDDLMAAGDAPKLAASAYLRVDGETYGVVGATTPRLADISSPGDTTVKEPGAGTNDMDALATHIQPEVDELLAAGVDKIILTTHLQQIALERELIGKLRGVDIVIAGGSDTLLADAEDVARGLRSGDTPADTYPIVTANADGDPALIVSTDGEYSYVGRLVVAFDADGRIMPESVDPNVSGVFATTASGTQALWGDGETAFQPGAKAAGVRTLTEAIRGVVVAKDGEVFGATSVYLNGAREDVRTQETNLGNLTADANLAAAQAVDASVAVSIKNGGGIRAAIGEVVEISPGVYEQLPPQANPASGKQEGQISQLDIENSLRFDNQLTILTLSAADLLEIMEHAVSATEPGATPGQFPQVGGMAFSFDPAQTPGDRIQSLAVLDDTGAVADVIAENGEIAGDPDRPIRVVTLNFLAGGGDGYPFDTLGEDVNETGIGEQSALADYLAANYAGGAAFMMADTEPAEDARIQNLSFRDDTVTGGGPAPMPEVEGFAPAAHIAVPGGGVAEIVAAAPDGLTLYYTDAGNGNVGIVDIADPSNPSQIGTLDVTDMDEEEPTSAAVTPNGQYLLVTVRTGDDADNANTGLLKFYDLTDRANPVFVADLPVGVGPDSVAAAETTYEGETWTQAVVAIEDEESVDGDATLGGSRPGRIDVIRIDMADPGASTFTATFETELVAALQATGGANFTADPQPEYVSINADGTRAAVSLQENNAVAVVDISNPNMPALAEVFSTGTVTRNGTADVTEDGEIVLEASLTGRREPDMVAYTPDGLILTANEGDSDVETFGDGVYSGGRGFTVFNVTGEVQYESGAGMEEMAVMYGHYPDERSGNRGIEVEAAATGTFGEAGFLFPASERGSFIGVYRADDARNPSFLQFLPTGIGPEGIVTVTNRADGRMLLVSANEADGTLNIWEAQTEPYQAPATEPMLMSTGTEIPWGALSGLTGDGTNLWTITDNAFTHSRILRINLEGIEDGRAVIDQVVLLTDEDGNDLEVDPEGLFWTGTEFWLASEAREAANNELFRINANGQVEERIAFPADFIATYGDPQNSGYEGVAVSSDGRYVYLALQRGFDRSNTDGRIMRYDTQTEEWVTARYPFDVHSGDQWTGLSGLVLQDDATLIAIERDNAQGGAAEIKRLYRVDVSTFTENMELTKTLVRDLLAEDNYLQEKVEGVTLLNGELWTVNDNDGAGWTRLINHGTPSGF
jgi:2',3'-cyclic-nucleotide 2'-phosphodiesterase (5'-nucleotidase family)/sugar lactone lactonase YvrE